MIASEGLLVSMEMAATVAQPFLEKTESLYCVCMQSAASPELLQKWCWFGYHIITVDLDIQL